MKEKYYGGFSLDQFRWGYPQFNERRLKQFAEVFEKCDVAYGLDGNLYKFILRSGGSKIGVVRNFNSFCMGMKNEPVIIDLELRSPNEFHENRFYHDESKRIKINILDVKDVIFVKKGNERLSTSEQEVVRQGILNHSDGKEIEMQLSRHPLFN